MSQKNFPDDFDDSDFWESEPLEKKETRKVVSRTLSVEVPALEKNRLNERRIGRIVACQSLYALEVHKNADIDEVCKFKWSVYRDHPDALSFAKSLVKGTLNHLDHIDKMITAKLRNWEYDRILMINKSILRMSVYSLLNLKDIPAAVVIDEAVDLAKLFSDEEGYRFINGILDNITKEMS